MAIENGMVIGAAQAYERATGSPSELVRGYVVADTIEDVETFADWLMAQCIGKSANSERALRMPHRLAAADTATVLHALLTGDAEDLEAARDLLRARYLESQAERIDERAAQLSIDLEG